MTPLEGFRRQSHTRARGRAAEDDGVRWLQRQGYRILERNVQFIAGEIDVVAFEGDILCFVEIKARATADFGEALESVTRRKQQQISSAASLYLAVNPYAGPCRFDVLAMDGSADGWRYTLLRDAFELA